MSRSFDELVTSTEHAEPVHPIRSLFRNHFYLDGFIDDDGGLWIALVNALLFIPLVMAAFFYPVPALLAGGAMLLVSFLGYEGYVLWRRRQAKV